MLNLDFTWSLSQMSWKSIVTLDTPHFNIPTGPVSFGVTTYNVWAQKLDEDITRLNLSQVDYSHLLQAVDNRHRFPKDAESNFHDGGKLNYLFFKTDHVWAINIKFNGAELILLFHQLENNPNHFENIRVFRKAEHDTYCKILSGIRILWANLPINFDAYSNWFSGFHIFGAQDLL